MALAQQKIYNLKNFSKVTLLEEEEGTSHGYKARGHHAQWESPKDLKEAFDTAGIELKVLLTQKIPGEGATRPWDEDLPA